VLSVVDGFVTANYKAAVSSAGKEDLQLSYRNNYGIIHKDMLEFECKNSIILSSHVIAPHLPIKTDTDAIYKVVDPMQMVFMSCGDSPEFSQRGRIEGYALDGVDVDIAIEGRADQLQTIEGRVDQLETMEERDDQLQTIEGRADQLQTIEGRDDQLQTIEGRVDQLETMEERDDQLQTMEERDDHLQTIEGRDDQLQTIKGRDDQLETIEGRDDQLETIEGRDDHLQTMEERDDQLQTIEGRDDQLETIEGRNDQLQTMEGRDDQLRPFEGTNELQMIEETDQLQSIEGTDQQSVIEASATGIRSFVDVTSEAKRQLPSRMSFDPIDVVCMDAVYLSIECGLRMMHSNELSTSENNHHINDKRGSIIGLNGIKSKILFHPLSLTNGFDDDGAANNSNYSPQSSSSIVNGWDTPMDCIQVKPYSFRNVVFEQYEADLLMEQGDDTIRCCI